MTSHSEHNRFGDRVFKFRLLSFISEEKKRHLYVSLKTSILPYYYEHILAACFCPLKRNHVQSQQNEFTGAGLSWSFLDSIDLLNMNTFF